MKIRNLLLVIAMLPWLAACAQPAKKNAKPGKQPFVAMFYNVENLFDTQDDPKINDDEFTPNGRIPWTDERLETKIKQIGQVMTDIAQPAMPDLVGFAEVENLQVLEMLTSSAALDKYKYSIVHYDSPDERGIDVAMLYNPATFEVVLSEPLKVMLAGNDNTRDILYVKGKLNSGDILHVFINHWPSRREGSEKSEPKRMAAANVLRAKLDAILKLEKSPNILILGDFNDEPLDKSIAQSLGALNPDTKPFLKNNVYSLLYPAYRKGEGSLYYKDWDLFDQVIVSGNCLSRSRGLHTSVDEAGIFRPDYLIFTPKNGVARPNRTMGERYFGGYSDHLPVYVKFRLK